MQVSYKCKQCQKIFTENLKKPVLTTTCSCGGNAVRTFKGIDMEVEEDNITFAIETMKYASNPSGKIKTLI